MPSRTLASGVPGGSLAASCSVCRKTVLFSRLQGHLRTYCWLPECVCVTLSSYREHSSDMLFWRAEACDKYGKVGEPASRTDLGKWTPRPMGAVRLMFSASFLDLYEPRGDPMQRPFNQSRHLQPGGHAHPHADGHPTLGEALSSLRLSLLPVHSK